jgi:RNA recognition motif-containing protein
MSNNGKKLFVYGVDKNLPKENIQEKFKKFGAVKNVQNAGKGCTFVSFESLIFVELLKIGMSLPI